jgi:predicted amidohydrolase
MEEKMKVAAVQMAPVYLDSLATTTKMCEFLEKAADNGARLVVFPELILSMYPTYDSPEYREVYNKAAIKIPGPDVNELRRIAKKNRMYVVSGLIEKDNDYEAIYNSSVIIDDRGGILGVHRKISLPPMEKTFFKQGDGENIKVFKTELGNVGIAMCYEHLNSLYRRSLYDLGEQIHCALWVNTDQIKHIVDSTARVTAMEGLVYVIVAAQVTPKRDKPGKKGIKGPPRNLSPFIGGSGILNPNGNYLSGPVFGKETIIYSEIAVKDWQAHKYGVNPRDDLFTLSIKK